MKSSINDTEGLLTAEELLKAIWPNVKSRPSLRWLREQQAQCAIPSVKLGRLVFFDVDKVRQSIAERFTKPGKP
jgi:hypothetical protein